MTNSNIPVMNSFCSYIFRKFIFDWFFHHCDFVLQGTSYDTKDKRTERSKSWSKGKAKDQDFVPQSSSHDTKDKRTERSQTWCKAKDQDEDAEIPEVHEQEEDRAPAETFGPPERSRDRPSKRDEQARGHEAGPRGPGPRA